MEEKETYGDRCDAVSARNLVCGADTDSETCCDTERGSEYACDCEDECSC
jgi:hypothetical protein